MPGQGLQFLPLSRIPTKWDPVWFAQFCREVLALADTRNALEGAGITITGQPGEPATISASEDFQNLLLQSFVVATPSGFLQFERLLAGEPNVVELVDAGANGTLTIRIADNGLTLGKLRQLSGLGILGNPVDGVSEVQNITPEVDKAVVHLNGTAIEFDIIDHTYISDFTEAAQDAVGASLTDTSSIDFTYDDGTGLITASIVDAYVEALVFPLFAGVTLLTEADETADFPAARRLVAGTNVTFDTTTPGELEINATGDPGPPGPPTYGVRMAGATWTRSVAIDASLMGDVLVRVPYNGTIESVCIGTQGGTGSCVVDIWKDTDANYPPTVADTITAAALPTVSSGTHSEDTTLTGWTTSVVAGDWLRFHLVSSSTFTDIVIELFIQETP